MAQQLLILNKNLQQISGNDNSFVLDFKTTYQAKRIVLNDYVMTNLISNFAIGEQDYRFQTATQSFPFQVSQIHLTTEQFPEYFNLNSGSDIKLSFTKQFNYITARSVIYDADGNIVGDGPAWAPIGSGWLRFGFSQEQLTSAPQVSFTAPKVFKFTQTPIIYVRLNNIPNAFEGPNGGVAFSLKNTSTFGGRLTQEDYSLFSSQQIIFSEVKSFRRLEIELRDKNQQLIQTSNNNDAGMDFYMSLTLHPE